MSVVRFPASTIREFEAARRRELDEEIDRNTQMLALARAEDVEPDLRPHYDGLRIWYVPPSWVRRLGYKAAVVRA